ncbi:MAG: bifunctional riboflavin kinase/FAD synthetase [Planctomycetota bacterium]
MKVLRTSSQLAQLPADCVLSIGNFDGVHLGHQQILQTAYTLARQKNTTLAAMTFEPHPVAILHPEKAPGVLTPLPLKIRLIQRHGVDYLIVLTDSTSLLRLTPADFIDRFLLKDVKPAALVEGEDFNFGAKRAGNIETLKRIAQPNGIEVVVVAPRFAILSAEQSVCVSSTTIRYMLQSGCVADAAALLGRHYRLIGQIIPGRGRGKQLGFPTLNMQPPSQVIPQQGVYAGCCLLGSDEDDVCRSEKRLPAVFSIGQARTFAEEHPLLIEAHLLDAKTDNPSGRWMAMDFVERIRPQFKFKSPSDLAAQIARDCLRARQILAAESTKQGI